MTVKRVHVVFKTHLDIGFTNTAAAVLRSYREEYIPKALDLASKLEAAGGSERFIWTTGSWLIQHYLKQSGTAERIIGVLQRGTWIRI